MTVGTPLGEKIILTELIAFTHLRDIQMGAEAISERSAIIASYAPVVSPTSRARHPDWRHWWTALSVERSRKIRISRHDRWTIAATDSGGVAGTALGCRCLFALQRVSR